MSRDDGHCDKCGTEFEAGWCPFCEADHTVSGLRRQLTQAKEQITTLREALTATCLAGAELLFDHQTPDTAAQMTWNPVLIKATAVLADTEPTK